MDERVGTLVVELCVRFIPLTSVLGESGELGRGLLLLPVAAAAGTGEEVAFDGEVEDEGLGAPKKLSFLLSTRAMSGGGGASGNVSREGSVDGEPTVRAARSDVGSEAADVRGGAAAT